MFVDLMIKRKLDGIIISQFLFLRKIIYFEYKRRTIV